MNEVKDWRGTPIEVGDVILYAVKHSTSVEVNEAIVSEVGLKPKYAWLADFGDVRDEDLVPYVAAEWQTSSSCYMPGQQVITAWDRTLKKVVLTNFEGITVVAKHRPPAFGSKPKMVPFIADL